MQTPSARRAVLVLLGGVAAANTLHPFIESDVCWHLTLGRAVARSHARTFPEPSSLADLGRFARAPEWLWDLTTYALHGVGGWTAVTLLVCACALGCVVALGRLVARSAPEASTPAWALALSLSLVLGLLRVHERPEAAVMVLLPSVMILAGRAVTEADTPRLAVALTLLTALWAQVHGSVLLAPLVFAARAAPIPWAPAATDRAPLSARALTLLAMLAAACTGALGPAVVLHVAQHTQGDAVRHLIDMSAPTFVYFDPRVSLHGPLYVALWGLSLAGMVAARAVFWRELAWALLGVSLVATAVRGLGPAGVLTAPLVARAVHALSQEVPVRGRRAFALVALALSVGALGSMLARTEREQGPIGHIGLREGHYPRGEARYLRGVARGTRVLPSVNAGAPLGWWLDGPVRTFLDSRIPLYFDDADFGVMRDLGADAETAGRVTRRYRFDVAVIERHNDPLCRALAGSGAWVPVGVSAGYSTFTRRGDAGSPPALQRLSPCEVDYLTPGACGDDHGAALEAEVERMRAWADPSFINYLRAERIVRCGVGGVTVGALLALVPSRQEAGMYPGLRDGLLASILLNAGDVEGSVDLVEARVRRGDVGALAVVGPALARSDRARLRALLADAARTLDDRTPPQLRAQLGTLCAAAGDEACARFHGVRAAALGAADAALPLCWLRAHAAAPAARRDADEWLRHLRDEARAARRPEPRCAPTR